MIIESDIGNFGNYKDLHRFMTEENIKSVTMTSNKVLGLETLAENLTLSKEEIEQILRGSDKNG